MLYTIYILLFFSQPQTSFKTTVDDFDKPKPKRQLVIQQAKKLINMPYVYSGSSPKGFDCSGFTKYIFGKVAQVKLDHSSQAQSKTGKKVNLPKARAGDLIFFKKGKRINHVAIVEKVGRNELWVIHSTSSRGVIRENVLKSPYWKTKIAYCRSVL